MVNNHHWCARVDAKASLWVFSSAVRVETLWEVNKTVHQGAVTTPFGFRADRVYGLSV